VAGLLRYLIIGIVAATAVAGCISSHAPEQLSQSSPTSFCRYEVGPGVDGEAVVSALTPHGGLSCASPEGTTVFVATSTGDCTTLPIRTTSAVKVDLPEGTRILRSCNALYSPETPRSGDVLLARVSSVEGVDEFWSAALRGGYFVTYYIRESELHCFEVADAGKARAAGLVRLAERFAVPEGLTWTTGTCRQAVGNTFARNFPWREIE